MGKQYKKLAANYSLKKNKTELNCMKISSAKDAEEFARKFYHEDLVIYESFFMITLNNSNNTTGYVKISQGGITATLVDVRIVAKYAIESLCTSIILVHNHPSGSLKPSEGDKNVTNKIKDALKLFDIKVLDHIILTEESYYSFADELII